MKLFLTLTGIVALASCSSYEQVATKATEGGKSSGVRYSSSKKTGSLEQEIFAGINGYRASIGKKSMERHSGLDALARQHSEFMMRNAGKFSLEGTRVSHYGFSGRASRARHEMQMGMLAENVIAAWNVKGPMSENLVNGWLNSPNHLHNIKGGWGSTGVGVVVGPDGAVYATQLFGLKSISHHDRFGVPGIW